MSAHHHSTTPCSVGVLMDPAFFREAARDATGPNWHDGPSAPSARIDWALTRRRLLGGLRQLHGWVRR